MISSLGRSLVLLGTLAFGANPETPADIAKLIRQTLQDAARVADDIPHLVERAVTLASVASHQSQKGQREDAALTFSKAAKAAQALPAADTKSLELRCRVLFEIALQHALANELDAALAAAALVELEPLGLFQLKGFIDYERDNFRLTVARRQAQAARFDDARATIDTIVFPDRRDLAWSGFSDAHAVSKDWKNALACVEKIESQYCKCWALMRIGQQQHAAGAAAEARETVKMARAKFETLDKQTQQRLQPQLAQTYANFGEIPAALQLAETIQDTPPTLPMRDDTLAAVYIASKDFAKAIVYARKAKEIHAGWEHPFVRLAEAQANAKQFKDARQTIEEINDTYFKARAFINLAQALHRVGMIDAAAEPMRHAVQLAEREPAPENQYFFMHPVQHVVAAAQAEMGDHAAARQWVTRQISAHAQAWGLVGVAEGLHKRGQALAKKIGN